MKISHVYLALLGLVAAPAAYAEGGAISDKQTEVLQQLLTFYAEQAVTDAKENDEPIPDTNFSADVGRKFYLKRRTWQSMDRTCSGCHTDNPASIGKHIETDKPIKPLAPAANPERFTDIEKVEKNFATHCMDLYKRDCYPHEKGNFIAYLMSVR